MVSLLTTLTRSAQLVRDPRDWECLCALCVQCRASQTAQHQPCVCPLLPPAPPSWEQCVSHLSQGHVQHTWCLQPPQPQGLICSPGDSLAPGALSLPWPSRECHSSTVALMFLKAPGPQIRGKAKSQGAAEVRCQGEAVTGELSWGKQNSSLSPLSAAGGLLSEQGLGTRGSGACSFGTCSP